MAQWKCKNSLEMTVSVADDPSFSKLLVRCMTEVVKEVRWTSSDILVRFHGDRRKMASSQLLIWRHKCAILIMLPSLVVRSDNQVSYETWCACSIVMLGSIRVLTVISRTRFQPSPSPGSPNLRLPAHSGHPPSPSPCLRAGTEHRWTMGESSSKFNFSLFLPALLFLEACMNRLWEGEHRNQISLLSHLLHLWFKEPVYWDGEMSSENLIAFLSWVLHLHSLEHVWSIYEEIKDKFQFMPPSALANNSRDEMIQEESFLLLAFSLSLACVHEGKKQGIRETKFWARHEEMPSKNMRDVWQKAVQSEWKSNLWQEAADPQECSRRETKWQQLSCVPWNRVKMWKLLGDLQKDPEPLTDDAIVTLYRQVVKCEAYNTVK